MKALTARRALIDGGWWASALAEVCGIPQQTFFSELQSGRSLYRKAGAGRQPKRESRKAKALREARYRAELERRRFMRKAERRAKAREARRLRERERGTLSLPAPTRRE